MVAAVLLAVGLMGVGATARGQAAAEPANTPVEASPVEPPAESGSRHSGRVTEDDVVAWWNGKAPAPYVPWLIFGWLLTCWTVSSVAVRFICPHALGMGTQALEENLVETLMMGVLAVLGMGLFLWAGVMLSIVLIGLPMVAIGTLVFFAVRSFGMAAWFVMLGGLLSRRLLPGGLPRMLAMLLGVAVVALAHVNTSPKVIVSVWLLTCVPAFGAAAMYWRRRSLVAAAAR